MKRIQSRLHKIGTYNVCKIYLPCFDDKRYILDDGINSLAYFSQRYKKSIKLVKVNEVNKITKVNEVKSSQ